MFNWLKNLFKEKEEDPIEIYGVITEGKIIKGGLVRCKKIPPRPAPPKGQGIKTIHIKLSS